MLNNSAESQYLVANFGLFRMDVTIFHSSPDQLLSDVVKAGINKNEDYVSAH